MRKKKNIWINLTIYFLTCTIAVLLWFSLYKHFTETRKNNADIFLDFYKENILMQMQNKLNETDRLTDALTVSNRTEEFEKAAQKLLERDEVKYVCWIDGKTVREALPTEIYGANVGKDLNDFSYVYALAIITEKLAVEGPVSLAEIEKPVFLFLQPIIQESVCVGEVIVALDSEYVLEQINLEYLGKKGYDFELWRVNPEDGSKEMTVQSDSKVDFSHASKIIFYLPTQWNLSIIPKGGWITQGEIVGMSIGCLLLAVFLSMFILGCRLIVHHNRKLHYLSITDSKTGFYNRSGFQTALDKWVAVGKPFVLVYLVVEDYNRISQLTGEAEERRFLEHIADITESYIKSEYMVGRLGEGNFTVAVLDELEEWEAVEVAKGLSLELLWKVRLNSKKEFFHVNFQYAQFPKYGKTAAELLEHVIHTFYDITAKS